jgi:hypothetical protein
MAEQVTLAIAVDIQTSHRAAADDSFLPDPGSDRPPIPADVARLADVDRKQPSDHHLRHSLS